MRRPDYNEFVPFADLPTGWLFKGPSGSLCVKIDAETYQTQRDGWRWKACEHLAGFPVRAMYEFLR